MEIQKRFRKLVFKKFEYNHSESYRAAMAKEKKSKEKKLKKSEELINKNLFESIYHVFRSVSKIAEKQRLFYDLPDNIDMQVLNGINVGRILHSDERYADIVKHIADEMKEKIAETLVTSKRNMY
jgi:GH15 family glucan-1,4-alpha-glucosidase